MEKRSLTIAGHRTSIALEPEFWAGLEAMADAGRTTVVAAIRVIDETRNQSNLASAIRVAVLAWYQRQV